MHHSEDGEELDLHSSKQIVDSNFGNQVMAESRRNMARLTDFDLHRATFDEVMGPVKIVVGQWKGLQIEKAKSLRSQTIFAKRPDVDIDPRISDMFNLMIDNDTYLPIDELGDINDVNISPMLNESTQIKRKDIRKTTRRASHIRNCIGGVINLKNESKSELDCNQDAKGSHNGLLKPQSSKVQINQEEIALAKQRDRSTYMKTQQIMAKSNNVVIASSNSIAKILNKVMVDMN